MNDDVGAAFGSGQFDALAYCMGFLSDFPLHVRLPISHLEDSIPVCRSLYIGMHYKIA